MNRFYSVINNLAIGDRIVVPKSPLDIVQHHAIYLGRNNGDYWFIENKERIGVQKVTAETFFKGVIKITRIEKFRPRWNYTIYDLERFANSKLGTSYHLTKYNCESFANEVQYGKAVSNQANLGIGLGLLAGVALVVGIVSSSSKK